MYNKRLIFVLIFSLRSDPIYKLKTCIDHLVVPYSIILQDILQYSVDYRFTVSQSHPLLDRLFEINLLL